MELSLNYKNSYKIFIILLVSLMLLPLLANSSIKDLKKPHFINHNIWINDPKRQKPPFLSDALMRDT